MSDTKETINGIKSYFTYSLSEIIKLREKISQIQEFVGKENRAMYQYEFEMCQRYKNQILNEIGPLVRMANLLKKEKVSITITPEEL